MTKASDSLFSTSYRFSFHEFSEELKQDLQKAIRRIIKLAQHKRCEWEGERVYHASRYYADLDVLKDMHADWLTGYVGTPVLAFVSAAEFVVRRRSSFTFSNEAMEILEPIWERYEVEQWAWRKETGR